jgi:hypothetical protein
VVLSAENQPIVVESKLIMNERLFKELTIAGLYSFDYAQTMRFATPNGNSGGGITVIVDENGAGKSVALDSLRHCYVTAAFRIAAKHKHRSRNNEPRVSLETCNGQKHDLIAGITGDTRGTFRRGGATGAPISLTPYYIPARRNIPDRLEPRDNSPRFEPSSAPNGEEQIMARGETTVKLTERLSAWPAHRADVAPYFNELNGTEIQWHAGLDDDNRYPLTLSYGDLEHPVAGAGSGTKNTFWFCDAFYDANEPSTIVIDEPELSLSPAMQKRLFDLFKRESKKHQIIYATHSPYLVDAEIIKNGAVINRVFKKDGASFVRSAGASEFKDVLKLMDVWSKPHLFGLEAREIFFAPDGVIVCEGMEDVSLLAREYRKHSKRRRGTFYGWGAHGNGNIEKLCNFFQLLGYEHVVGIYDDANGETEQGMNGKFGGKFFFHELPTPDVRDKPNKGITGIFDGNGEGNVPAIVEKRLVERFITRLWPWGQVWFDVG